MHIEIDDTAGFCFGVEKAIESAEDYLQENEKLYCLGDIVHNQKEADRLGAQGLVSITRDEYYKLKDAIVLLRAHGEPPETYEYAKKNNIVLIDATCPIVTNYQEKIKKSLKDESEDTQLVVYGKPEHPEVVGFVGQVNNKAIVVSKEEDLEKIDFNKPIQVFTQTTKSKEDFQHIVDAINEKGKHLKETGKLKAHKTLCGYVSNRKPSLEKFSQKHDMIIFVAGRKSSNGKTLFEHCKLFNDNCHFIEDVEEINMDWFNNEEPDKTVKSIGISGATSTPSWLMEKVKNYLSEQVAVHP